MAQWLLHPRLLVDGDVKEIFRNGRKRFEIWLTVDSEAVESRGGRIQVCLDFDSKAEAEKFIEEVR